MTTEGEVMMPRTRKPTSPGEILRDEFLIPMGMTQKELANHLGCDIKVINRLVNDRTSVTAEMALKLGAAFRTTPEFWLNAQKAVDLYAASARITGCSHPGIVEILEETQQILDEKIFMVFGGFHLLRHSDDETAAVIEQFKQLGVEKCGATHCTGDQQIAAFQDAYGENFVAMGTGRVLTFAAAN